ncbi:DUF262 domain-containing protein [Bifidobacterium coryneforme]|uniref:DUF262 domain-containing protein n=1 Tax=Bifidobacterium coryneforme TaxID=1687 RepID=UPI0023F4AF51|nr:DUF262 domain-containing protein [Bifidobacterium coryneforme]
MDMEFTPEQKTVKDILGSGSQLVIPRFQREYCWDGKVVQEFYEDIVSRLDFTQKKIKTLPYFIGTMLFLYKKGTPGDDETNIDDSVIEVVDGQQRLTTITIFLAALAARLNDESQVLAQKVFQYVKTTDDNDDPLAILTTKTSYPYFQNYVQTPVNKRDPALLVTESDEDESIKVAYQKFEKMMEGDNLKKQITTVCNLDKDALLAYSDKDILVAIRDELLSNKAIVIRTSERTSANMIFEILNGKGVHLANIDLIKNRLFEKIPDDGMVDNAEVQWKKIQNNLRQRDEGIGLATFYRHFWISKYGQASSNKLYDNFKRKIKPCTEDRYKAFLLEMEKESMRYSIVVHPRLEDFQNRKEYAPIVQSMSILSDWFNVNQSRIGLLALMDVKDRGLISLKEFADCAGMIEVFHFAFNSVCRYPANRFEGIYSKFAISLRKAATKADAKESLRSLRDDLDGIMPGKTVFVEEFCKLRYSGRGQMRMNVATKYAVNAITSARQGKKLFENDLSIEHIIPESKTSELCPDTLVTNIGNLIGLEKHLNEEAADLDSIGKRELYERSNYKWVSDFYSDNPDFKVDKIQERAKELAVIMYDKIIEPRMAVKLV